MGLMQLAGIEVGDILVGVDHENVMHVSIRIVLIFNLLN
jgi:ABC-type iron transport system FetAB permease component